NVIEGGMGRSAWPKSMRAIEEERFIDPFQDESYDLRDQLIVSGRDAKWPVLAIGLGDEHSSDRFESVASVSELSDDCRDTLFGEPIQCDSINAFREHTTISVDVGVRLLPQQRVLHETEKTIDPFSELCDRSK